MARYGIGYELQPDEQLVPAHNLQAILCERELRVRVNGGWWYLYKATPNHDTRQVMLHITSLRSLRKEQPKILGVEVPEDRQILIKVGKV